MLDESAAAVTASRELSAEIVRAGDCIADALRDGHTLLACGNGGSAADAQHFAGELMGRFYTHIDYSDLDRMIAAGVHTGFGDEWVRVGAVKLFADGSISERTARVSQRTLATSPDATARSARR